MPAAVVLDSMILSEAVRPRGDQELKEWIEALITSRYTVVVPSIVDYEVRRYLLLKEAARQLERLDDYLSYAFIAELTIEQLRRAAALWAEARRAGRPSTSSERLDKDVIIAAQTEAIAPRGDVVLATENARHFELFIDARSWRDITP